MMHLQLPLSVFSFLVCVASFVAVRNGDYSVVSMPHYGVQYEDSDYIPERNEYTDRSQDAPARLDYKYEEEHNGDERIWVKPLNKNRNHLISRSDHYIDSDKDDFDEVLPQFKTNSRFVKHRSRVPNKKIVTKSNKVNEKYISIGQSDEVDYVDNKKYYNHKDAVRVDDFDSFSHRLSTRKKARRKARDRVISHSKERENENLLILKEDEMNDSTDRKEYFENKKARNLGGIIDRGGINKPSKESDDYEEFYDMKRILNMKNRLPALFRQKTVQTKEAHSIDLGQSPIRRAGSLLENSVNHRKISAMVTLTMSISEASTSTNSSTTTASTTTTSMIGNSTELSLAEKSRLSILKKARMIENARHVSSTEKPPVLMQVTRKMRTVVMVEKRPPELARDVSDEPPERLQRARRLMRHKLVADARSIHDLTDNWDEMVCDYIDVALLDVDAAPHIDLDNFLSIFAILVHKLIC